MQLCTEGVSMMRLTKGNRKWEADRKWKNASFSQYARMNIGCDTVMGYTIRTDKYR